MRFPHYLLLLAVHALLTLPHLGAHSLWDMDEGVNTECTREMMESGTWIVPTFNWELRSAKPVMMYWLQRFSFEAFGLNEWAARFPSVLLGLGTVLLIYELGRRMFDARTGLLGGIVLSSSLQFCLLSHAATPDAPLIFFFTLTLFLFYRGQEHGRRDWFILAAMASGLAVLSKGPIGLALPGLIALTFFAWNRELKRVLDFKLIWGIWACLLVAVPWYLLVSLETHGDWPRGFFLEHNLNRAAEPMEGHGGWPIYYVGCILVMSAPWSSVIGLTLWYSVAATRNEPKALATDPSSAPLRVAATPEQRAQRFLICWFGVVLVFFSIASTKLPNYIGPLYPALALLTARFLIQWMDGVHNPKRWLMAIGVFGVFLTGFVLLVSIAALSVGGDKTEGQDTPLIDITEWWFISLAPIIASGMMGLFLILKNRSGTVIALTVGSVLFVGLIAYGPPVAIDNYKAAKPLVLESGARQPDRDIRLGIHGWTQEWQSIPFYAERRIEPLAMPQDAADFLAMPLESYLFVPEPIWETQVEPLVQGNVCIAAKHYDFYRNATIIVVTNDAKKQP